MFCNFELQVLIDIISDWFEINNFGFLLFVRKIKFHANIKQV